MARPRNKLNLDAVRKRYERAADTPVKPSSIEGMSAMVSSWKDVPFLLEELQQYRDSDANSGATTTETEDNPEVSES